MAQINLHLTIKSGHNPRMNEKPPESEKLSHSGGRLLYQQRVSLLQKLHWQCHMTEPFRQQL